jgi:hypothetical protein
MKKIMAIALLLKAFLLSSQVTCVPDTNNTNYGTTPQADEIPCVERRKYYEQVVQVLLPSLFSQAEIDSVKLLTVTNLPAGIQLTCGQPDCFFYAEKTGCFVIHGITTDSAKRYDIGFTGKAYIKVNGNPTTFNLNEALAKQAGFDIYLLVIEKDSACGQAITPTSIKTIEEAPACLRAYYSKDTRKIFVDLPASLQTLVDVKIFDALGKNLYCTFARPSEKSVSIQNIELSNGLYFIHIDGKTVKLLIN